MWGFVRGVLFSCSSLSKKKQIRTFCVIMCQLAWHVGCYTQTHQENAAGTLLHCYSLNESDTARHTSLLDDVVVTWYF